jgi:hypothetical protein
VRIAGIGTGTEEAVVRGAVIGRPEGAVFGRAGFARIVHARIVFGRVGDAASGGKGMFFAGEDACKEKYPSFHSTRGLGERRWPLHLPIKRRPLLRISRNDRVSPSDSLGSL